MSDIGFYCAGIVCLWLVCLVLTLRDSIRLSHKLSLYFPSESKGKYFPSRQDAMVADFVEPVASRFGGATVVEAVGYWRRKNGTLVRERKVIVSVFVSGARYDEALTAFKVEALNVKHLMDQDAVSLEVDGQLLLI